MVTWIYIRSIFSWHRAFIFNTEKCSIKSSPLHSVRKPFGLRKHLISHVLLKQKRNKITSLLWPHSCSSCNPSLICPMVECVRFDQFIGSRIGASTFTPLLNSKSNLLTLFNKSFRSLSSPSSYPHLDIFQRIIAESIA